MRVTEKVDVAATLDELWASMLVLPPGSASEVIIGAPLLNTSAPGCGNEEVALSSTLLRHVSASASGSLHLRVWSTMRKNF